MVGQQVVGCPRYSVRCPLAEIHRDSRTPFICVYVIIYSHFQPWVPVLGISIIAMSLTGASNTSHIAFLEFVREVQSWPVSQ